MNTPPHVEWNPDYKALVIERIKRLEYIEKNPGALPGLHAFYATHCVQWISDWAVTHDPRNVGTDKPAQMPFIPFPRQVEFLNWLYDLVFNKKEDGLIDKCRDMGATWLCVAFSVWMWRYHADSAIGWGSRKADLVHKIGDPDSIFEKIRMLIRSLPAFMLPRGYNEREHSAYMREMNPENGATINGESGDNIGRGGRKTVYFKDESAFYERPELIEAALGNNTNVQIDLSTHNGTGTIFFRKSQTYPAHRVFAFDWWQNPNHTQEWYDKQEAKYKEMGTPWLLEQEVLRNPQGSVPNVVIPYKWIRATVDAHRILGFEPSGERRLGLDVADEGVDENAACQRHGILIQDVKSWPWGTTTQTARIAYAWCDMKQCYRLVFDSIGVGAGIKGTTREENEIREQKGQPKIESIPWCAGGSVVRPWEEYVPGKTNEDMFLNAKAQAWWGLRERFRRTYEVVEHDELHDPETLISISPKIDQGTLTRLCNELTQATYKINPNGKIVIDKQPENTKSPNMADAVVIGFAELDEFEVHNKTVRGLI